MVSLPSAVFHNSLMISFDTAYNFSAASSSTDSVHNDDAYQGDITAPRQDRLLPPEVEDTSPNDPAEDVLVDDDNISPALERGVMNPDEIYMEPDEEPFQESTDQPSFNNNEDLLPGPSNDVNSNSCPEEVIDGDVIEIETYPRAGEVKNKKNPRFQELLESQIQEGSGNIFHPFLDGSEFRLAQWLNTLPRAKVDEYCQLPSVSSVSGSLGLAHDIVFR
jgi:hypothetical protein